MQQRQMERIQPYRFSIDSSPREFSPIKHNGAMVPRLADFGSDVTILEDLIESIEDFYTSPKYGKEMRFWRPAEVKSNESGKMTVPIRIYSGEKNYAKISASYIGSTNDGGRIQDICWVFFDVLGNGSFNPIASKQERTSIVSKLYHDLYASGSMPGGQYARFL